MGEIEVCSSILGPLRWSGGHEREFFTAEGKHNCGVISVLSVNNYPSGRVIYSIKSQLCIPSTENNFPPVAYAPAEGTQYAAANFNLS